LGYCQNFTASLGGLVCAKGCGFALIFKTMQLMNRNLFVLPLLMAVCAASPTSLSNKNNKPGGGQPFREVTIGKQTWMAQNLDVAVFSNGDTIPQAQTSAAWKAAARQRQPAWCYVKNDSLGRQYGKLYNFFAVSDARGLAPLGWRIPDGKDWSALGSFLGGDKNVGIKMKSTAGWKKNGHGTNASGFDALPSGARTVALVNRNDGFVGAGSLCYWWSGTKSKRTGEVLVFGLSSSNNKLMPIWDTYNADGYAVRCIKQ
jgi:uncharacterized protein (TIGR02145 family)